MIRVPALLSLLCHVLGELFVVVLICLGYKPGVFQLLLNFVHRAAVPCKQTSTRRLTDE